MFRDNHPADLGGDLCGLFALLWAAMELQTKLGEFGPLVFLAGIGALFFVASGIGTFAAIFESDDDEDDE